MNTINKGMLQELSEIFKSRTTLQLKPNFDIFPNVSNRQTQRLVGKFDDPVSLKVTSAMTFKNS